MNPVAQPALSRPQARSRPHIGRRALYTLTCVFTDVALLILAFVLAWGLRALFSSWILALKPVAAAHWFEPGGFYLLGLVITWMGLAYEGVYSLGLARLDRTERIVKSLSWSLFLLILITFSVQRGAAVSRMLLLLSYLTSLLVLVLLRPALEQRTVRSLRMRFDVALVQGTHLPQDTLAALSDMGFRIVGDDDATGLRHPGALILNAESETGCAHLAELEARYREIGIIPPRTSISALGSQPVNVRGSQIFIISHPLQRWTNRCVKRAMDIAGAASLLLISLPVALGIALAVRIQDGGPALFAQNRLGQHGRTFSIWKFRTMVTNAEQRLQDLLASDAQAQAEYLSTGKLRQDPRITPLGRWLRRYSLDEIPQFWNVLKGDMSLIGPRPFCFDHERDLLGPAYDLIATVRPGLTGIWQTSGRSDTSYHARRDFDVYYVRRWSLWLDIALLAKTIQAVILPGAY